MMIACEGTLYVRVAAFRSCLRYHDCMCHGLLVCARKGKHRTALSVWRWMPHTRCSMHELVVLPAEGNRFAGNQIGLMLFKVDDEEVLNISTADEAAKLLQTEFPNLYPLLPRSEVAAFAQRPLGKLPTFQYVWPHLHHSDSVVLAGDAIHTVKPYFGIGVNSALDDVRWLSQCLQKHQVRNCELQSEALKLTMDVHRAFTAGLDLFFPPRE